MRLILWLLIGLAVVWLVKGLRRPSEPPAAGPTEADRPPTAPAASPPAAVQLMLRCARCGVHLPARDAVSEKGLDYCSAAHRDSGPRAGGQG